MQVDLTNIRPAMGIVYEGGGKMTGYTIFKQRHCSKFSILISLQIQETIA